MSVQKHKEEIHPQAAIDRHWQLGTTFLLTGVIVGTFGVVFGVVFIPEDLRAGSDFWITIASLEMLLSASLVITGFVMKHRASLEQALEWQE